MVNSRCLALSNYDAVQSLFAAALRTATQEATAAKEQFDIQVKQLNEGKYDKDIVVPSPGSTDAITIAIEKN